MEGLAFLYRELVFGGHLLALGTASIAAASSLLLGKAPTLVLLLLAYLFSYGAYALNRGLEMQQDLLSNPARTQYLMKRSRYIHFIAGAFFGTGYIIAALLSLWYAAALLPPLVLALLYSRGSPSLRSLIGARRLKDKLLVKNLSISFGWSLIPILVGVYFHEASHVLLLFSPYVFLRLMVNTLLFDIRDVEADTRFGVRTLPAVMGPERTYRVIRLADLSSALYLAALLALSLMPRQAAPLLLLSAYSWFYVWLARRGADMNLVCDLIADGEYLLWGPVVSLGGLLL